MVLHFLFQILFPLLLKMPVSCVQSHATPHDRMLVSLSGDRYWLIPQASHHFDAQLSWALLRGRREEQPLWHILCTHVRVHTHKHRITPDFHKYLCLHSSVGFKISSKDQVKDQTLPIWFILFFLPSSWLPSLFNHNMTLPSTNFTSLCTIQNCKIHSSAHSRR